MNNSFIRQIRLLSKQLMFIALSIICMVNMCLSGSPSMVVSDTLSSQPAHQEDMKNAIEHERFNSLVKAMGQYTSLPEEIAFTIPRSPDTQYKLLLNITDGIRRYELFVDGEVLQDTEIKIYERSSMVSIQKIYLSEEPATMNRIGKGIGSAIAQIFAAYAKAHNKSISLNTSNYMLLHQVFNKLSRNISWSHQGNDNIFEPASKKNMWASLSHHVERYGGVEIKINKPEDYICQGISLFKMGSTNTQFKEDRLNVWITTRLRADDRIDVFVSKNKEGPYEEIPPWISLPFQIGVRIDFNDLFDGVPDEQIVQIVITEFSNSSEPINGIKSSYNESRVLLAA